MRVVRYAGGLLCLLLFSTIVFSQQLRLGKNPYALQKSAILELESDNQGLLFPRLADTASINSLAPPDGMVIFHTLSAQLMIRSAGYWKPLATTQGFSNYWNINGNSNGVAKKLGNIDNYALGLITNNTERLTILAGGNIGIGNINPAEKLDITGNLRFSGALMPAGAAGTAGQVLRSAGAGAAPTWINFALSGLSDATITSPANGQLLQYNGTRWVNTTPTYLSSIDTSNIANFHTKVKSLFSAGTGINYNAATGVISSAYSNTLAGLGDATITSATNGQLLQYNGTRWVNTTPTYLSSIDTSNIANFHTKVKSLFSAGTGINYNAATGVISSAYSNTLAGLGDATITSAANGQLLQYNGTKWVNITPTYLTSIDTSNIANFHLKVKSRLSAGTGINYNAATGVISSAYSNSLAGLSDATITSATNGQLLQYNGTRWVNVTPTYLSTIDTSNIASFHLKVKSLFSAGSGISYNATTGAISSSINTANFWTLGGNAVAAQQNIGTSSNYALPFITNNTEKMRLTTTGYLGIGTTNPGNYLEVAGTNTGTGVSGLRLTNLGTSTLAAATAKVLTVNSNGDVVVANNPAAFNWAFTGNAGIDPATNFLGTTDDKQLILKSNGSPYVEMGRRQTLGLVQGYTDYTDNDEQVMHMKSAVQFYAPAAQFYKPKIYVDANGNFRTKGSSAGTDYFEFGAIGSNNDGGFEFIIGDDGDEPILFKSYNYQTGMSEIMRLQSGRMAVGSNAFDASNPEKLLIDAGVTNSYNLMTGKGSINNYLQINVHNRSNGNTASSDIVATADNGSETSNFIDMGINSSGFTNNTYPILNGTNTGYLYSTGGDMVIGNGSASNNLRLFTGGLNTTNERLRIDATGNIGVATTAPAAKLDVDGTFKMGDVGTTQKNLISFESTLASLTAITGGSMNILTGAFNGNSLDVNLSIAAANNPTSTRGTVVVSFDRDLPANISVASARISATNQVRVRFMNTGTVTQNLPAGLKFYVTITEF